MVKSQQIMVCFEEKRVKQGMLWGKSEELVAWERWLINVSIIKTPTSDEGELEYMFGKLISDRA